MKEAKNVMLINIPKDINRLIRREQSRIDFDEEQKLKKHAVVYRMLRQWYQQKSTINELRKEIEELKSKISLRDNEKN